MAEYFKVKFEPYHCYHCHLLVRTLNEHTWHEDSYPGPACDDDPRNKLTPEEEEAEMDACFDKLLGLELYLTGNKFDGEF